MENVRMLDAANTAPRRMSLLALALCHLPPLESQCFQVELVVPGDAPRFVACDTPLCLCEPRAVPPGYPY